MPKFHQDSNESELGGPNCCSSHLPVVQEGFWRADPGHSAAGRCQRSLLLLEPDQQYSAWVVFQRAGLQHNHFSRQSNGFLSTCARGCERRHPEPPAPHLWLILCYPKTSQQNLYRNLQLIPQVTGPRTLHLLLSRHRHNLQMCWTRRLFLRGLVQRCIDMNVTADPAPVFVCGSQCCLSTYMGQILYFNISVLDVPRDHRGVRMG